MKALDVCGEADEMLDPNSQKAKLGKQPKRSAKSGRRWGEGLEKKVKELEKIARTKKKDGLLPSDGQAAGLCSSGVDGSASDDDDDDAVMARNSVLSSIRRDGPVCLTQDVALHILRKRLVALQEETGGGSGGGCSASDGRVQNRGKTESATTNAPLEGVTSSIGARAGRGNSSAAPSLTPKERASKSKGKGRKKDERRGPTAGSVGDNVVPAGLENFPDDMLVKVYTYWAAKRLAYNGPMLRCLHVQVGATLWQRAEDPEREVRAGGEWSGRLSISAGVFFVACFGPFFVFLFCSVQLFFTVWRPRTDAVYSAAAFCDSWFSVVLAVSANFRSCSPKCCT